MMNNLNRQKISSHQAFYIILGGIIGDAFLFLPRSAVDIGAQNAWIVSLISTALLFISATVAAKLAACFPKVSIIEGGSQLIGKWPGKLYALSLVLLYAATAVIVIRQLPFIVNLALLPDAPTVLIVATFLFICALAAYRGVETVARLNELMMPLVIVFFALIMLLVIPNIDYENVLPFFYGFHWQRLLSPQFLNMYYASSAYVLVFMLVPYMLRPEEAVAANQKAILFSGGLYVLGIAVCVMVLSAEVVKMYVWPTMRLFSTIRFSGFLIERVDLVFTFIWLGATYTTAIGYFYATVESSRRALGLKDKYQALLIVIWYIVIFAGCMLIKDFSVQAQVVSLIGLGSVALGFVFPAFFLIIARLRGKGGSAGEKPAKTQQG